MEDTYRQKGLRKQLVQELRTKGIQSEDVLHAINIVPRHLFLDNAFQEWAYKDVAFPIDSGQTISQPYTVALQTSLLQVKPKDKILEIGTGSGYQACVLHAMGAKVYTIERHEHLYKKTTAFLENIGFKGIRTFYGDGFLGLPLFAPFDKIIITAAAPEIPQALIDQIKVGGYLVIPFGEGDTQTMLRITKLEDGSLKREEFGLFQFVPMLKGTQ